jgi:hypothetical protein
MDILRKSGDYNIIINQNTDFQTNLGWEEGMNIFEEEVLDTIINPADNYETVRYIHEPYSGLTSNTGETQCDIWFKFYFIDSNERYDNGLDYNLVGITPKENALMTKQSTNSFFRLEFFKTPNDQPPTRLNRKFVFARNLSLPIGEKFYYTTLRQNIHVPVFMGSNYKNKENMYLFWFQDDSVLSDSTLSGNTFYMTAKFYNGVDGSIIDFTNTRLGNTTEVSEYSDLYYKVVINKTNYTYKIYQYNGTQNNRIGHGLSNSINFYEKGGEIPLTPTPTPPVPSPSPSAPLPTPPAATPASSPAALTLTFSATTDSSTYGEYENEINGNNKVTVTVRTSISAVGSYIWWSKHSGTADYSDFKNDHTTPMLISNTTGHTFILVIDNIAEVTEGIETFSVGILTGTTSPPTAGGEVAYTPTFTIADDSIPPQYRYVLLERVRNYEGCPDNSDVTGDQNYYWDQFTNGSLDGPQYIYTGTYCYRYVTGFNDVNLLGGKSEISTNDFRESCPSCNP